MTDQHSRLEQTLHRDPSALDLAGLVAARLCHDLVSPLGAIGNGIELLEMTGAAEGPEIDLIRQSARTATAKLRFYRIAFGPGGAQRVDLTEAGAIAADPGRGARASVAWTAKGSAARSEVRLAFLAVLCAESAMPSGGTIRVGIDDAGWRIEGTAPTLRAAPDLWDALGGGPVPTGLDAAKVHFALAAESADVLRIAHTGGGLTIAFPHARES